MHIGHGQNVEIARPVNGPRLDEDIAGLGPVGTAIHAQRTADAPWNTAIERQPGDARLGRGPRHFHVRDRRSDTQPVALFDLDLVETPAKPDHHTLNAPIADKQVRAEAYRCDGHISG